MTTTSNSSDSQNEESKNTVAVFCRLRPLKEDTESSSIKLLSSTHLSITSDTKLGRKQCNYGFSYIFPAYSEQIDVFNHVAVPLLENLVNGKNGLLFTYGVTGSGKTYTLTGEQKTPGIMPHCIHTLFNSIEDYQTPRFMVKPDHLNGFEVQTEDEMLKDRLLEARSTCKKYKSLKKTIGDANNMYLNNGSKLLEIDTNQKYTVFVSYIEIYNNIIYDLLDDLSGKILQAKIIREDSRKNMYVNNVMEIEVKSAPEAFEIFAMGQKCKHMARTNLNTGSSRSHSIFNIRVVQLEPKSLEAKIGQLSLVDLAGSERCNRTQNIGIRLKEASSINNSLMSLRTCLEILRENQLTGCNKLVPYRDSRLTLLFKNYFEGDGQVRMIVCINPSDEDCEENLQVLRFAEMSQDIKISKPEVHFTPYRKTPKSNKHTPVTRSLKAKKTRLFTFNPDIPNLKLNLEEPEQTVTVLTDLVGVLRKRITQAEVHEKEFKRKHDHFRKRLTKSYQDFVLTQTEIRSLKALLKKKKQTEHNLNAKVSDLELSNENLARNNEELEQVIRNLQNTVDEKNLKLNQHQLEREKAKQKLVQHSEKMTRELDEILRRQRQQLESAMQEKDAKLQRVKQILESNDGEPLTPSKVKVAAEKCSRKFPRQQEKEAGVEEAAQPLTNNDLVVADPNHKVKSIGEVWLEHNAISPKPLSSILQPSMKKRRSVSKLRKLEDVADSKQNKYCLVSQHLQGVDEVETRVYKGDIVPTCGGGAQVIFNDVECLRHESPMKTPSRGER